jgi:hypothetical protein
MILNLTFHIARSILEILEKALSDKNINIRNLAREAQEKIREKLAT